DRARRQPGQTRARSALGHRQRIRRRRRGRLAGSLPRPRFADRARPLLGPRSHLSRPRGGPGARRGRPPPRTAREGPRGPRPRRAWVREVTCAGPVAGRAPVGAARRLGLSAKAREVRGVDRVVIRDGDDISALLTRMGSHSAVLVWEERRMRREVRATANRLANFDDANLRRSARAAVAAGARVERALESLGDDVPEHLRYAGQLRVTHKQASLEELGQLADPPMTKDAVAGRIRRLLSTADKHAEELGIPGTEASLTPEMLEDR